LNAVPVTYVCSLLLTIRLTSKNTGIAENNSQDIPTHWHQCATLRQS